MPGRVRILDDLVVNQIAAGEVVERPASVVKELIENSVDAEASEITVVIANGGRAAIEVLDNGCGMNREDALLAVERFGTSKIREAADLQAVRTHGFRGEALPSIASVSRFTLATCPGEENGRGTLLELAGGKLERVIDGVPMPRGTRVAAKNLFYNVPARRKFLRSEAAEEGGVKAVIADYALAYPGLRLVLNSDGREVLAYAPAQDFFDRVRQCRIIPGTPVIADKAIFGATGKIRVVAALSLPADCVSGNSRLRLIVNNRAVRDRLLLKAVRDGYGNFLKPGKHPAGVVKIELPASEIDVNVHPQKTEVRFREPSFVFAVVRSSISQALGGTAADVSNGVDAAPLEEASSPRNETSGIFGATASSRQSDFFAQTAAAGAVENETLPLRYLGQIFGLYLLFLREEELVIIDMHAAHERITYHRLHTEYYAGSIVRQSLLVPEVVEVPPERISEFEQAKEPLLRLGIECEDFGENAIIVRALPAALGNISARAVFEDLFSLNEWADWAGDVRNKEDALLARLACHGSVRAGRILKEDEARELVRSLERAETSGLCPHGRPVTLVISSAELAGMFDRT